MVRRRSWPRRSAAEWGVRATLAIGAAWLGYGSITHSFAYMIRGSMPEDAHARAPDDGRITALLSAKLAGPEASAADRVHADDLARLALRQDPTAVAAVATLGINAQIRDDTAGARRYFVYSQMLSRRDLRTRLWAIEDAVARNDIPAVLRNYDIALRTSRTAPDLLFPVLSSAIPDPAIRTGLVSTLATRPAWGEQFVAYVSSNGSDPIATARLFEALHHRRIDQSAGAAAALIARLLADGKADDAWRYYAAITPGVDRRMSRDPQFLANSATPSPFEWTPITDSGVSATIQRSEQGGIFDFSVPPNLGGPLLRQAQMLPPGAYLLEGRSTGIEQTGDARLYWLLGCSEGREFGRVYVSNSAEGGGRFTGRFTVQADCPVQQLMLVARASDQMAGVTGQITYVRLRPANR